MVLRHADARRASASAVSVLESSVHPVRLASTHKEVSEMNRTVPKQYNNDQLSEERDWVKAEIVNYKARLSSIQREIRRRVDRGETLK